MNGVIPLALGLLLCFGSVVAMAQTVELRADVGWLAPVLKHQSYFLGFSPTASTSLSTQQILASFPSEFGGGAPVEWGVRSRGGLQVALASDVTWTHLYVEREPEVLEPPELAALLTGGGPVTVSSFIFREDDVVAFDLGHRTSYDLGLVMLWGPVSGPSPAWEATLVVEFFCRYALPDGTSTGELVSEDVGLPTAIDVLWIDFIPIGTDLASWGGLKAAYER